MNSGTTGWALAYTSNPGASTISDNAQMLLTRTGDGALTWTDVTPAAALPALKSVNGYEALDPADAEHAYLAVTAGENGDDTSVATTTVYVTADGGATWTASAPVKTTGTATLVSFADPEHGWLDLTTPGTTTGKKPVAWLYKTTDGGKQWTAVDSALPVSGLGVNDFCQDLALNFQTDATGWLTYSCRGETYLMVTHNAGSTWTQQPLPLPSSTCSAQAGLCDIKGPQFVGGTGFLTVAPDLGTPHLLTNSNQGKTWQLANLPSAAERYPQVTFFSAKQGVLVPAASQEALGATFYTTGNAGKSWTPVRQGTHFTQLGATIDFATQQDAFEWISGGDTPATGSQIYTTTNTGKTWTPITPALIRG